jgi:uncharacterized protein (DUF342 family)
MSDYDDIISENLEIIASELSKLNQNMKVKNRILILQNDRLYKNNNNTIMSLRQKVKEIEEILKN